MAKGILGNKSAGHARVHVLMAAAAICLAVAAACALIVSCGTAASDSAFDGSQVLVEQSSGTAEPGDAAESNAEASSGENREEDAWESEPAHTPSGEVIPEEMVSKPEAEHKEDVVLVMLDTSFTPEELTAAINASGCTVPQDITEEDVAAGFVELTVADNYDVAHATAQLELLPELSGAQPNFVYHVQDDETEGASDMKAHLGDFELTASTSASASLFAQAVSINDPSASKQWALDSINAYEAWETSKAQGSVTVAILDNGFLVTHEDLADNIVATYNAADGGTDVTPSYGNHGTHVAGIVAATANNGTGVAGVSYNAGLLPIQVFDSSTEASSSTVAKAFTYVLDNADTYNIKVVNMSVGATSDAESATEASLDTSDKLLVSKVTEAYDAGILTVFSAGNDAGSTKKNGPYNNYPSDWIDCSLGVIALVDSDPAPTRASYSNYNMAGQTTKDISAPGSSIYSTVSASTSSYSNKSGTSMAAPCVAGVAALVYAANPNLTAGDVAGILCDTAADLGDEGWDEVYGAGEVDAAAAVQFLSAYIEGETTLLVGGTTQLAMSAKSDWQWDTGDSSVAEVSETGLVTGVTAGTVTITASSNGITATKVLTVFDVSFTGDAQVEYGSYLPLVFNENPATATWIIDTTDGNVARVAWDDDTGELIGAYGLSVGTAAITATNSMNSSLSVSYPIEVVPCPIKSESVEIEWPSTLRYTYTGEKIEPRPELVCFTNEAGETLDLVEGSDYELSYKANVKVGQGVVVLTGCGNFTGSVSESFEIAPGIVGVPEAASGLVYTGSAQRGVPESELYTLSGTASATDAGGYTATAELADPANYTWPDGTTAAKSLSWKIAPALVEIPEAASGLAYTGSAQQGVTEDALYTLSGTTSATDAGEYTATAKLANSANYVWSDGTTAAKSLSWKIAPALVEIPEAASGLAYTGSVQRGVPESGLYTLSGTASATDAGEYATTVKLADPANYVWSDGTAGAKSLSWEIAPASVEVPKVVSNLVYTGSAQRGVAAGDFYTLSGTASATDAGEYATTVKLADPANYVWSDGTAGAKSLSWKIAPKAIEPKLTLSQTSFTYNGAARRPALVVADGATKIAAKSYTATWPSASKDVGTYTVSVSCHGNYTGKASATFRIVAASLAKATVTGVPKYRYYTGSAIKPAVTVKLASTVLARGTDYAVTYKSNRKAGTATVAITGKGNYKGVVSRTFEIVRKPVYAGASKMPVSSTAAWTLSNCTMKVLSGSDIVSISGKTIKAKKAGKAKLGIYNAAGARVAVKTVKVYALSGKTRTVALAADPSYALDVQSASTANKTNIYLYHVNGTKAQNFRFALLKDGTYTLKNPHSGRLVSVANRSNANGANVYQYTAKNYASQRWRITVDSSNRLTFVSKGSGKALDLAGGKIVDMRNVRQYRITNSASQKWVLI